MRQKKYGNKMLYIELLRILAASAVILIHVTAIMMDKAKTGSCFWNVSIVLNSLARWCIPLFFMISGCVFLNRENITIKDMVLKYVYRLLIVLVCFGIIYYFFDLWIYGQVINWKHFLYAPFSVLSGNTGYHLWYIYDIVLIYLVTPILNKLVKCIERRALEYILILFIVFVLLIAYFNSLICYMPVLSDALRINFICDDLAGYLGCFLMGYYISHYKISNKVKIIIYAVGMVGIIIMPLGNWLLSITSGGYISVLSKYCGLFNVAVATCLFIFFREKEKMLGKNRYVNLLIGVGGSTFGIYLVHVFFAS